MLIHLVIERPTQMYKRNLKTYCSLIQCVSLNIIETLEVVDVLFSMVYLRDRLYIFVSGLYVLTNRQTDTQPRDRVVQVKVTTQQGEGQTERDGKGDHSLSNSKRMVYTQLSFRKRS